MVGTADHKTDTLFMVDEQEAKWFISKLKKSKRLKVEALFFQESEQQFDFDVSGLNW